MNENDIKMVEIGYTYLHRTNHNYNKDMILETQEDLKQFNNLFNAGFEALDNDLFIDTDDNKDNTTKLININTNIKEIVDETDDPFIDS